MAEPWAVIADTSGRNHVIPHGDYRQHIASEMCWCHPTNDEGVMVHHSIDKREAVERGKAKQQ